jgi:hypothetical protein
VYRGAHPGGALMSTNEERMLAMVLQVGNVSKEIFDGVVAEADRSIRFGSEITSAPGQPVDSGTDLASWQTTFESPTRAVIATNLDYAEGIEEGLGSKGQPVTYGAAGHGRSTVGGSHSVKITVASLPRIVEVVTARVKSGGGSRT